MSSDRNFVTTHDNSNEMVEQNEPNDHQPNQRYFDQNQIYPRPPVVTDEVYSGSGGGLYNDCASNNIVSVIEK